MCGAQVIPDENWRPCLGKDNFRFARNKKGENREEVNAFVNDQQREILWLLVLLGNKHKLETVDISLLGDFNIYGYENKWVLSTLSLENMGITIYICLDICACTEIQITNREPCSFVDSLIKDASNET